MSFTKGPWQADRPFEGHVCTANGERMICSAMGLYDGKETTRAENMANARLIAAAPDLYEAVRDFLAAFEAMKQRQDDLLVKGQTLESASRNWEEHPEAFSERLLDLEPLMRAVAKAEGR